MTLLDAERLCASYAEWQSLGEAAADDKHQVLRPFVPVEIHWDAFDRWCAEQIHERTFHNACEFATAIFDDRVNKIIGSAQESSDARIARVRYIALFTEEIGQDQANDLATARFVSEIPGCEREVTLFENQRMFHAYAVAVAAAYAVRENVDAVFCTANKTYGWA